MALFTLKWVSGKLGLRNQSRGTQSRFLLKTESSAINSQYLDKNTTWVILGRFGVISIRYLVCDAFDTILGRQTRFMIFCGTFRFQLCFKRLCGKERLARASMSLKTKTRASGSSFVIRCRSVKLDAVILIPHKSSFGYALCRDL